MGRLFWKIFSSFWLAMILTNLGVAGVMAQYLLPKGDDLLPEVSSQLSAVASVLEHDDDLVATKSLLENIVKISPYKIFVFDDEDQELLDRSLHSDYFNNEIQSSPHSLQRIVTKREVTSLDGKQYTVIIESPTLRTSFFQWMNPKLRSRPHLLNNELQMLFLRLGMTIFLSGLVCFWLAWYLARPVRRLREASNRLANGELDVRVKDIIGSRRDEIADLGKDFDYMAERLQLMISRQKQLIQDVSHELRSPLARLQVAMGLTRRKVSGIADDELDRIEREANRLESLVAQILTLARLEESKTKILEDHIDIAKLLESIVSDAEYEARSRDGHIYLDCKIRPTLNANSELLLRALENIIRNAVHYTDDSTSIHVVMEKLDKQIGWLKISITDHGQGVPEEQISKLFEPFVQIAKSRDNNSSGYGLGLTIAKRAIELHGGYVSAYNCKDAGLCVEVNMPTQAWKSC